LALEQLIYCISLFFGNKP